MLEACPIGETIDRRFKITALLGEGGFGAVYLAEDLQLGRKVALKFIHCHALEDTKLAVRFEREGRTLAQLQHKNIVTCFSYGLWRNRYPYLAFEFLDGKTLYQELKQKGTISCQEALEYAIQICSALTAMHNCHLIHRDLKPENIMVLPDGTIKLIDFSLVRIDNQKMTEAGMLVGTVLYASPEQIMGQQATPLSDIYSLGATLYHLISGRPPLYDDDPAQLMKMQVCENPCSLVELNPAIPLDVDRIIQRAMDKSPAKRYQNAGEFEQDIQSVLTSLKNGSPVAAGNNQIGQPHRRAVHLGAVVCTILFGVSIIAGILLCNESILTNAIVSSSSILAHDFNYRLLEAQAFRLSGMGFKTAAAELYVAAVENGDMSTLQKLKDLDKAIQLLNGGRAMQQRKAQIAERSLQLLCDSQTRLFPNITRERAQELARIIVTDCSLVNSTDATRLDSLLKAAKIALYNQQCPNEWASLEEIAIVNLDRLPLLRRQQQLHWKALVHELINAIAYLENNDDDALTRLLMSLTTNASDTHIRKLCKMCLIQQRSDPQSQLLQTVAIWMRSLEPKQQSAVLDVLAKVPATS
jgi:serine/threonine protein kinase